VAYLDLVKMCFIDAIKESIDFNWIRSTGCSLHYCEAYHKNLNSFVCGVSKEIGQ